MQKKKKKKKKCKKIVFFKISVISLVHYSIFLLRIWGLYKIPEPVEKFANDFFLRFFLFWVQNEVTQLRAEMAQLKALLLAHKDCPITIQQRNSGQLTLQRGE